jgi:hypothetical protein
MEFAILSKILYFESACSAVLLIPASFLSMIYYRIFMLFYQVISAMKVCIEKPNIVIVSA